jgi:PncC family amidohydrolase
MAEGARRRFSADYGISVTGIAGPGGATDTKPVGLVYVAVADAAGDEVRRHQRHGDRHENRLDSARVCLELLLERIEAG